MIAKLYEINKEYEIIKAQKRSSSSLPKDGPVSAEEDDPMEMEAEGSDKSDSDKSEQIQISLGKIEVGSCSNVDNGGSELSPRKRSKRPKKRVIVNPPSFPQEILFKEQPIMRLVESNSSRRYRRPINYMKLNEGILCESDRPEVDETNYESDLSKKRLEHTYDPFTLEERHEGQNLEEIEEEEEKSNEKDNLNYIFNQDYL